MSFVSSPVLRAEIIVACGVLNYFRIVEGFGHVSARVEGSDRVVITPRRALALVTERDLVELDYDGRQIAGTADPPLEAPMHLAVYRRRADVTAIARGHPRHVATFACAAEPLRIAHGLGANLGVIVPVFPEPFLIAGTDVAERVADTLGDAQAIILQANGMLAVGQSVAHACVRALLLEETAELQLLAQAAGLSPRYLSPEQVARRRGDDPVHEPIRAWEYYVAVADGRIKPHD
jgi:ribulose-5-phosphate 4-epimerase/fuculose-1-phosphate aldolase